MPTPTVFFLSDYGTRDEFVGVVKSVVAAGAPGATIIDLTHQIPPFDVAAGSRALVRSVPFVGPGVVLAVVDPGVGTGRRGLCLEVGLAAGGSLCFVGPDNGLLVAAAALVAAGSSVRAVELPPSVPPAGVGSTFDGRDLFAPAVAALCRGATLDEVGRAVDPAGLVRLPVEKVVRRQDPDGRWSLQSVVGWVDSFGNVQSAVAWADVADVADAVGAGADWPPPSGMSLAWEHGSETLRWVTSFEQLAAGELGLLWDANGRMAIVAGQASAASRLGLAVGSQITLTWPA